MEFLFGDNLFQRSCLVCVLPIFSLSSDPTTLRGCLRPTQPCTDTHTPFLAAGTTNYSLEPTEAAQGPGH